MLVGCPRTVGIRIDPVELTDSQKRSVRKAAAHVLRLDEDLSEFYSLAARDASLSWVKLKKAGRMLRSPTVFEDIVKTICTTNCSWGLTKSMVGNLVSKLGSRTGSGARAFPTPGQMAARPAAFYREEIRAGYRAEYLKELAERTSDGDLHPESWLTSDLPTDELKKQILGIKGVGEYAADNLLKLIGRYDGLALDSFLRSEFSKKHNNGKRSTDGEIKKHYRRYGKWRGLAIWFDMSERWLA